MRLPAFLILFFPAVFIAQNPNWESKIDPKLLEYAQHPDTAVEFLVIMQEQADLSATKQMRSKDEKGRYVMETLSALSEDTQRDLRDLLRNNGVTFQSFWIINGLWVTGPKSLIEQIAQMPEVGRLELNPVWHFSKPVPGVGEEIAQDRLPLPWGLTRINADDVWNMGYTGAGIVIGGQDTGYEWKHPALKDKYRGWDGSNADHNYNWHDAIHAFINGGPNTCGLNLDHPCDDDRHGTHTMGTMVGSTSPTDVYGVAPDATWIGCRNMEEGDGTPSTYIECFEWFIAPTNLSNANPDPTKAPHVINNSWGCPTSEGCNSSNYATMDAVVNNVRSSGIMVVVSAGNTGSGCSTVDSPAAIFDGSYSVGAIGENDGIAGFSSRGPVTVYTQIMKPDISAPGVNVLSSIGRDNDSTTYAYQAFQGTSMAGPHICGVVALILDARPDLIGDVDAIENLINNNAVPKFDTAPFCGNDNGSSRPNNVFGWGRVDVLEAINSSLPIELLDFTAKATTSGALLEWATGSEIDCSHFSVQRSPDGRTWQQVGQTNCKGNGTHQETFYSYSDSKPRAGLNYYRLEQVDYSGKVFYSPVRVLTISPSGYILRIAGLEDKAFFEVVGENANDYTWQLEICSMDGKALISRAVGSKGWVEVNRLPSGVYLAVVRNQEGIAVATQKWIWSE